MVFIPRVVTVQYVFTIIDVTRVILSSFVRGEPRHLLRFTQPGHGAPQVRRERKMCLFRVFLSVTALFSDYWRGRRPLRFSFTLKMDTMKARIVVRRD